MIGITCLLKQHCGSVEYDGILCNDIVYDKDLGIKLTRPASKSASFTVISNDVLLLLHAVGEKHIEVYDHGVETI